MGTLLQQYFQAVREFDDRLQKVEDDQWSLSTPCRDWDVRTLVAHVINEQRWAPFLLRGAPADDTAVPSAVDPYGDDAKGAWASASSEACEVFAEDDALERHVYVWSRDLSARDFLWRLTVNLAVHAWDLALAIGADDRLDPELVRRIAAEVENNLDDMAASGHFGKPVSVPPGADLQARTLALFGRRRC